jgi:hypothetical protein
MKKNSLKNQIATMLNGKKDHFVRFYVKDLLYKVIQSNDIKPGKLLLNGNLILFFELDQKDSICVEDDKAECDAIIRFLFDPAR